MISRSTRAVKKSSSSAKAAARSESESEIAPLAEFVPLDPKPAVHTLAHLPPPLSRSANIFGGHLTDEIRQAIIQKHKNEPDLSQVQLTDWLSRTYGIKVNRTTVGRTLARTKVRGLNPFRKKIAVKKNIDASNSSSSKPKKLNLNQAVYDWYLEKAKALDNAPTQNGNPQVLAFGVSTFREKATELAESGLYEIPAKGNFSHRWLKSFLKQFGLQVTALPLDEDETAVMEEANSATANISEGEADSEDGETGSWPNELLPYLAPKNEEDAGNGMEEGETANVSSNKKLPIPRIMRVSDPPNNSLSGTKSAQQHLTSEMRTALLKKREEEPAISQLQLSEWLNETFGVKVHRATIGRNLKRLSQEISGYIGEEPPVKKSPGPVYADFEQALLDWWMLEKNLGRIPSDKLMLEKAKELKRQGDLDVPATFHISASWRSSFKQRYGLENKAQNSTGDGDGSVVPGSPTMLEVHHSVNVIRKYLFNANYDQDTKKNLMQGLDDIYIKLGEANKRAKDAV